MKQHGLVRPFVAVVAVLSASALLPAAEAPDTIHEARAPVGISWETSVAWASAEVTVSGPPGTVGWTIPAGEPLRLEAAGLVAWARQAGAEPDGLYHYEVRLAPALDETTRAALARAREADDHTLVERLRHQGVLPTEPVMTSGSLRLENGSIVMSSTPEVAQRPVGAIEGAEGGGVGTAAPGNTATSQGIQDQGTRDQVIADDLIVQGSECLGFDCVNNESFGFDTLRLKENNLRIKFDDTSSTGSFPSNDWQLTANDSANGGASRFSIDDITSGRTVFTVEAGAPSSSLYVDNGGRVGLGTSNPVVELHITDGDTPTVRLAQDSSSGFAAQTWDVAGNETSFFIRDATNGSTLPFRIRPGAASNSLVIDSDDQVGVGILSPSARLHVAVPSAGGIGLEVEALGNAGSDHASLHLTQSGSSTPSDWDIRANATTGALEVKEGGNSSLKFQKGAANNSIVVASAPSAGVVRVGIGTVTPAGNAGVNSLDVNGSIFQRGGQLHADYVFAPGYDLETIADHAAAMWRERHLPAVPGRRVDGEGREVIEVGSQARGMLEELEKAHIYIEQLNAQIEENEATIATLEQRLAAVEAVLEKLKQP